MAKVPRQVLRCDLEDVAQEGVGVGDVGGVGSAEGGEEEGGVGSGGHSGDGEDVDGDVGGGGGSGGGGSVGGCTSDYGIEVYDTNGTTKVLSSATRYLNALSDVTTYTFAASGNSGSTYDILLDMTDLTTSNSDVYFITGDIVITTSRLSDRFRLTNTGQSSVSASFVVIRF